MLSSESTNPMQLIISLALCVCCTANSSSVGVAPSHHHIVVPQRRLRDAASVAQTPAMSLPEQSNDAAPRRQTMNENNAGAQTQNNDTPKWPEDDDDFRNKESDVFEQRSVNQEGNDDSKNSETPSSNFLDNDNVKNPSRAEETIAITSSGGTGDAIFQNNYTSNTAEGDFKSGVSHVDDTTFALGGDSPSTEYHRSQSIHNEATTDSSSAGETRTFDQIDNLTNDQVLEDKNKYDAVGSNMTTAFFEGSESANSNNQYIVTAFEHSESSINDDEDDGFFAMIQSTLQVLLLAAFFALGLVFRRRVRERMIDHPSLNAASAIKEEAVKAVIDFATWLSETRNESERDITRGGYSVSTVEEGGESVVSGRWETRPLATATDEEWGWDDDDGGGHLELSGNGRDTSNEDDDLAVAIALSLSESGKSVFIETQCPVDVPNQHTSAEPAGSDSRQSTCNVQQLQKTNIQPKPNNTTIQNDGTDDIFEYMGLSSFPKKAGSSLQKQMDSPSPTLKADLTDEIVNSDWGDDVDLDDLLGD